jgi:hypothetical protein
MRISRRTGIDQFVVATSYEALQEVKAYVQPVSRFQNRRKYQFFGMSDQIPILVKKHQISICISFGIRMGGYQVNLPHEWRIYRKRVETSSPSADPTQPGHGVEVQLGGGEERPISGAPLLSIIETGGSTLTRQCGEAHHEKFRITNEARQVIHNYPRSAAGHPLQHIQQSTNTFNNIQTTSNKCNTFQRHIKPCNDHQPHLNTYTHIEQHMLNNKIIKHLQQQSATQQHNT